MGILIAFICAVAAGMAILPYALYRADKGFDGWGYFLLAAVVFWIVFLGVALWYKQ
jgi:hypothetical protein